MRNSGEHPAVFVPVMSPLYLDMAFVDSASGMEKKYRTLFANQTIQLSNEHRVHKEASG